MAFPPTDLIRSLTVLSFSDNSHIVLEERAPLYSPAPPTLSFSIKRVFFPKSTDLIAAAYPEGPAPIIHKSNFSI